MAPSATCACSIGSSCSSATGRNRTGARRFSDGSSSSCRPGGAGENAARLVARDRSAEERAAQLVVDIEIRGAEPHGLRDPLTAVVVREANGRPGGGELIVRRVPPGEEQFNGYVLAALRSERWRVCAGVLADGSILPADGTRRLQASAAPA